MDKAIDLIEQTFSPLNFSSSFYLAGAEPKYMHDIWFIKIVTLEKEMATHSSILAWKSPWTEKPGGLQFMGLQRIGHD